jgi:hypothetical protein
VGLFIGDDRRRAILKKDLEDENKEQYLLTPDYNPLLILLKFLHPLNKHQPLFLAYSLLLATGLVSLN